MTEDDYFYRQETRGEGGNDRVPLGEICLRRGDCRFHGGHHCFVYVNDRIRSSDDHVQTINNHDAFRNDRLPLGNPYLQTGDNRFGPANYRFRYGNSYFLRAVGNSLIRGGLMSAGNNRLYCGNDYLHLGDDYLRTEDDRRCRIDNRVRQGNGSLQHDNDRGRWTNNRSRGGKYRVVDRVDRRGNGNTCFAIVNDCR